jgi:DNA polymerase-3 subunit beta
VQLLHTVVPARDLKVVLQHIRVAALAERVLLQATDLEVGLTIELPDVRIHEDGEALVQAAWLLSVLREVGDEELSIEGDAQAVVVRGHSNGLAKGSSEFKMTSPQNPGKFPDLPGFTEENFHEFAEGTLKEMIRRTLFAAATQNPRYALAGVRWELAGDRAELVASDSKCLAIAKGNATFYGSHETNGRPCVVPSKAMKLLERKLGDSEEVVRVTLRPNDALFKTDGAVIYSRLVEGRYPEYRKIFPTEETIKIALGVGPFYAAVRQASVATDEESKRLKFCFTPGKLIVTGHSESKDSAVSLAIEYQGPKLDIAFDPKFLINMLKVLSAEDTLIFELVNRTTVGVFRRGDDFSYLVLPMT